MSLLILRRHSSKSARALRSGRWQKNALHLPPLAHLAAKTASSLVVTTKSWMGLCTWERGPTARPCWIKTVARNAHCDTKLCSLSWDSAAPSAASINALKAAHTGTKGPTL
ncbi:unnamed protein product, partial [Ectocarpus sp. 12 AP-2014]